MSRSPEGGTSLEEGKKHYEKPEIILSRRLSKEQIQVLSELLARNEFENLDIELENFDPSSEEDVIDLEQHLDTKVRELARENEGSALSEYVKKAGRGILSIGMSIGILMGAACSTSEEKVRRLAEQDQKKVEMTQKLTEKLQKEGIESKGPFSVIASGVYEELIRMKHQYKLQDMKFEAPAPEEIVTFDEEERVWEEGPYEFDIRISAVARNSENVVVEHHVSMKPVPPIDKWAVERFIVFHAGEALFEFEKRFE